MIPPCYTTKRRGAFTLVELLTVIAIIAVLMGLLFPAIGGVREMARKAQAKNDVTSIVNAVKAYYTEYGKYPILSGETDFGPGGTGSDNLFNVLRANGQGRDAPSGGDNLNPRRIAFMEIPPAKQPAVPKSGVGGDGKFYDPWGNEYKVRIDADYDNKVNNPHGGGVLDTGAIAWSIGKDKLEDSNTDGDDVVSWQ